MRHWVYWVPAKGTDDSYSECLPGKPKPDADYHEGGEVVGHKTGLVGERVDALQGLRRGVGVVKRGLMTRLDLQADRIANKAKLATEGLTGLCDACDEGYARTKENWRMHGLDCPRKKSRTR
jgi:hypothetical protein